MSYVNFCGRYVSWSQKFYISWRPANPRLQASAGNHGLGHGGGLCAVNSGSASAEDDAAQAVCRGDQQAAGGTGLISWCEALQKPIQDGVESLQAIRDMYSLDAA